MFGETAGALNDFYAEANNKECFSCEKEFTPEDHNDHAQGYFCDECLCNGEGY